MRARDVESGFVQDLLFCPYMRFVCWEKRYPKYPKNCEYSKFVDLLGGEDRLSELRLQISR